MFLLVLLNLYSKKDKHLHAERDQTNTKTLLYDLHGETDSAEETRRLKEARKLSLELTESSPAVSSRKALDRRRRRDTNRVIVSL